QVDTMRSGIDGVIGMDILKEFALKFDFVHQTLYLMERKRNFNTDGMFGMPLTMLNNVSYISLELYGAEHSFLVDTGFSKFINLTINDPKLFSMLTRWEGFDDGYAYNEID